jgi:hypothetical protein
LSIGIAEAGAERNAAEHRAAAAIAVLSAMVFSMFV